jgi:20S proteasome alpha/beta subunit
MTVIVALRTPEGSVLATDGRACANSAIFSDSVDKIVICGDVALAIAGVAGALPTMLRDAVSWDDVYRVAAEYCGEAWCLLAANARRIRYLDGSGTRHDMGPVHTLGSGGQFARGFLSAHTQPKTLKAAAELARAAVKVACKFESSCGGKIRVVQLPR